jgi:uncharacterized integral membrane protein
MGTQTSDSSTRFENEAPVVATVPDEGSAALDRPAADVRLASTRAGRAWARLLPALFLLVILLVFVLQNLHRAKVSFLGLSGTLPLAVALLAAAAIGALFVLAVGSVRIVQLRRVIRRERHARH